MWLSRGRTDASAMHGPEAAARNRCRSSRSPSSGLDRLRARGTWSEARKHTSHASSGRAVPTATWSSHPAPKGAVSRNPRRVVVDSRTAPAVGTVTADTPPSASPRSAVPAGTTSAPAGRDDARREALGLQVVAARAGPEFVNNPVGRAAAGLGPSDSPATGADVWLDQPPPARSAPALAARPGRTGFAPPPRHNRAHCSNGLGDVRARSRHQGADDPAAADSGRRDVRQAPHYTRTCMVAAWGSFSIGVCAAW